MGCCGKNRKRTAPGSVADLSSVLRSSKMQSVSELPGTQGDRVLVVYIGGKGGGKHYYRGPNTNYPYKVKYGEYYYVDPKDAKFDGDKVSKSLFVRVKKDAPKVKKVEPKPEKVEVVDRTPREIPVREPILYSKEVEKALPDINNLRWAAEIRHMDFTPDEANKLLKIEKAGKGRVKVIKHLQKFK